MNMSSGSIPISSLQSRTIAFMANGLHPKWRTTKGPNVTGSPSGRNIPVMMSFTWVTTGEPEMWIRAAPISLVICHIRCRITSKVIGSIS